MIIIYRADSGEILRIASAPEVEAERNVLPGEAFILSDVLPDPRAQYVVDGALVSRPAGPAALVGNELQNLPVPALIVVQSTLSRRVFYSGEATQALSFDFPGTYRVWVQAFPYLDTEFSLTQA